MRKSIEICFDRNWLCNIIFKYDILEKLKSKAGLTEWIIIFCLTCLAWRDVAIYR